MGSNPEVSIIIPVYNGSNYLREAIDSALAQSYENIEVIVVNDGSDDNGATESVASSYGKRICYFAKENGGVASALNKGIREMRGKYFSWLSHDDLYLPNKVGVQIERLKSVGPETVLYSDFDMIDKDSAFITRIELPHIEPWNFRASLVSDVNIHGCTLLIPRRCFDDVGLFDENLKTTQDYDMWFRMSARYDFVHMPEVLVHSRAHSMQGQVRLDALHKKESESLYRGFLETIHNERLFPVGIAGARYMLTSAISLEKKNLREASEYALHLSGEYASPFLPSLIALRIKYAFTNIEKSAGNVLRRMRLGFLLRLYRKTFYPHLPEDGN